LLFDGLSIHKTIAFAMIVAQYETGDCSYNTCLFAMHRNIFQKDVTIAAAANGCDIFPDF
jgi:hypothetical protein